MSQVRKIKQIKEQKKQGLKKIWDKKFFLGSYLLQSPGNDKIYLEQENHHENIFDNYPLDKDLIQLWCLDGVGKQFRNQFIKSMMHIKEDFHAKLLELEKKNMKKIQDLFTKVANCIVERRKILNELWEYSMNSDIKKNEVNEKTKSEIKQRLLKVQSLTINIFLTVNEIRQNTYFSISKGKIITNKTNASYIFNWDFLIQLNNDLTNLRNGIIGKLFNLEQNFDPFLTDIINENHQSSNDDTQKKLVECLYLLIHEIIYGKSKIEKKYCSNYSKNKHKLEKKIELINERKNGNKIIKENNFKSFVSNHNGNSVVTKEQLEKAFNANEYKMSQGKEKNFSPSNEINKTFEHQNVDNLISVEIGNNNHINEDESKVNIDFYRGNLSSFQTEYTSYFTKIPQNVQITFNSFAKLEDCIYGKYPLIITKRNHNEIVAICVCSFQPINPRNLNIIHFSLISLEKEEIEKTMNEFLKFIQDNIQSLENIFIDLYYSQDNEIFTLDQNINNIFKNLNFKWEKLENKGRGIRYQRMKFKLKNNQYEENTQEEEFKIQSYLIANCQNEESSTNEDNKEFNEKLNMFHMNMCEKLFLKETEIFKTIHERFEEFKYIDSNDQESLQTFLKNNQIKQNLKIEKGNSILITLFKFNIIFDSVMITSFNGRDYLRIKSNIEIWFEKETNQRLYIIIPEHVSYPVIIGDINTKFKEYLHQGNIYETFKSIYSKFIQESVENTINSIYIPISHQELSITTKHLSNTKLKKIKTLLNYHKIEIKKEESKYLQNSFIIEPEKNDIVINGPFFIGVMNIDIINEIGFPCVFCGIIE